MKNLKEFEAKYPDLYRAIYQEGVRDTAASQAASEAKQAAETDKSFTFDERIKAEWDKNSELRDEFGNNYNWFSAYCKGEAEGKIKRCGGGVRKYVAQ